MHPKVNKWIAEILGEVYKNFPKKIFLCPEEIDKDANLEEQIIIADLIQWLSEENIIRYEEKDLSGCFSGVSLTLKGFAVLKATPDPLKEKASIGEFLTQTAKQISINTLDKAITTLLQAFLRG